MPRHGRRDNTHAEVRGGWRAIAGVDNVHDTGDVGNGFPDLVVGWLGHTFLFEVKSPGGKLRPNQALKKAAWKGGIWLRVDGFHDSIAKVKAEMERRGLAWPALRVA